jgi:hypothetical protein
MIRLSSIAVLSLSMMANAHAQGSGAAKSPEPAVPKLTFAFEMHAMVGPPQDIGQVRGGRRRIVPITGGTFAGPGFRAKILPGGADWQTIQPDGFTDLDTRYTIQADSGGLVYVQNAGMRHAAPDVMEKLLAGQTVDPSLVYFRTVPRFETAAPDLQWLTRAIFVGVGERYPTEVVIRFYKVE